ncbi:hypothetical protein BJ742DRAFT_842404 [Cladochytrium replicatum]|nr:hypothetical protein BJ742DRAFT_842404 [Cladochytrium replicatum]
MFLLHVRLLFVFVCAVIPFWFGQLGVTPDLMVAIYAIFTKSDIHFWLISLNSCAQYMHFRNFSSFSRSNTFGLPHCKVSKGSWFYKL